MFTHIERKAERSSIVEYDAHHFYVMPRWLYNIPLKPIERELFTLVYNACLLFDKFSPEEEPYYSTNQVDLSIKCHVSEGTINSSLKRLEDLKLIRTEHKADGHNTKITINKIFDLSKQNS